MQCRGRHAPVSVLSALKASTAACRRRHRVPLLVRFSLEQMWQNLMDLERVVTEMVRRASLS